MYKIYYISLLKGRIVRCDESRYNSKARQTVEGVRTRGPFFPARGCETRVSDVFRAPLWSPPPPSIIIHRRATTPVVVTKTYSILVGRIYRRTLQRTYVLLLLLSLFGRNTHSTPSERRWQPFYVSRFVNLHQRVSTPETSPHLTPRMTSIIK